MIFGFIDKSGKIISFTYEEIESFFEELAAVCRGGIWGFIDKSNKLVIPYEYDGFCGFNGGDLVLF